MQDAAHSSRVRFVNCLNLFYGPWKNSPSWCCQLSAVNFQQNLKINSCSSKSQELCPSERSWSAIYEQIRVVEEAALFLLRHGLFCRALFGHCLLGCRLCGLGFRLGRFHRLLLGLYFLLRQLRRSELLSVERVLRDPHRRERLAMSGDLLVLLFLLVVEDQDFLGAVVP